MKNKFISKLEIVWNNMKSTFGNLKKNVECFSRSIIMTFTKRKSKSSSETEEQTENEKEQFEKSEDKFSKYDEKDNKKDSEKNKENDSTNESAEWGIYITPTKVRRAISHFLDFCASIIFVSTIIVFLKPDLLLKWNWVFDFSNDLLLSAIDSVGRTLFGGDRIPMGLSYLWNVVVTIGFLFFLIVKLIVVLICKDSSKIVSILLIVLSLLICYVVGNKSFVLLLFIIVLYFTFQIACFMPTKTILKKFFLIVVFTFVGYIVAHVFLSDDFLNAMINALDALKFPDI